MTLHRLSLAAFAVDCLAAVANTALDAVGTWLDRATFRDATADLRGVVTPADIDWSKP